jgi:large subunit ribosomal protein L19e
MRENNKIDKSVYRQYYRRAKGGQFKDKAHVKLHLEMEGHIKSDTT